MLPHDLGVIPALLVAATLLSSPPEDRVVAALGSGTLSSFKQFVDDPRDLDEPAWSSVRDFLGRYECVEISGYRAHDGVLDIEATAVARNARHERRPLSQTWSIKRDGGKVIVQNETDAEAIGECDAIAQSTLDMAAATSDAAFKEQLLQSAIGLAESVDDPRNILTAMGRHAEALYFDYELTRAFDYAKQLEALSQRMHFDGGEALAILLQVRLAHTLGRTDETKRLALRAAAIAEQAGDHESEAIALYGYGQTLFIYEHQHDAGLAALHHALEITPRQSVEVLSTLHATLGFALADLHRMDEAETHLEPAIRLPQTIPRRVNAYWFATHLRQFQGRFDEGIALAREGIRLGADSLWLVWTLKGYLGQMLVECGDSDGGVEALREAIDLIETRRAIAPATSADVRHFSNKLWLYHDLEDALIGSGRNEEALEVAERTRGRVLYDVIRGGRQELALSGAERARERALNENIIDANRELATAVGVAEKAARRRLNASRAELHDFISEMAFRHVHSSASTVPSLDLPSLRMPAETAAIVYSIAPTRVNAYVVRDGHVTVERLGTSPNDVTAAIKQLREQIETRNYRYAGAAKQLEQLLIQPIARHIAGARRLIIVPDGALWNVPFQVLPDASGSPLAERFAVSYTQSLEALGHTHRRPTQPSKQVLLAFADPVVSGATTKRATERGLQLGPLPDAAEEVSQLQRLYGANRSSIHIGANARESEFKRLASDYRILHLATHGIVDDKSPLYSAVVLGTKSNDDEDGLLEMREIQDLDLDADLVVLSSCDTARGDVAQGEGIIGLSWAFQAAGCRTTVVSQWKADSRATSELMVAFHRHLLGGATPAEALRRAQLALRESEHYAHPYYWAPFVVIGGGM